MLHALKFKVKFATNGRTIEGDHTFEKGLTAITGANEKGKSLRLEMIRFGLFGSKALRGAVATYESLECALTFEVKGETYLVSRTLHSCKLGKLTKGKVAPMVAGTKPTNDAIIKILGYDLEVFDIANACLQGEIEAMSKKLPSQRKAMVDRTIGLDVIDDVLAEAGSTAGGIVKQIEALEKTVDHALTPPQKPEGYDIPQMYTLEEQMDNIYKMKEKDSALRAELRALATTEPVKPQPTGEDLEVLEALLQEQNSIKEKVKALNAELNRLAPKHFDPAYKDYTAYLALNGPEKWEAYHADKRKIEKEQDFLRSLVTNAEHLANCEYTECPQCKHKWTGNEDLLNKANAAVKAQSDYIDSLPTPVQPDFNNYGSRELVELKVQKCQASEAAEERRQEIMNEVISIEMGIDERFANLNQRIMAVKKYMMEDAMYDNELGLWNNYLAAKARIEPQLIDVAKLDADLNELRQRQAAYRLYEDNMVRYKDRLEKNQKTLDIIDEYKGESKKHKDARQALLELKPKVKTYLIPSLSKVASQLLSDMTNGVRNRIEISEDFDIVVDGDALESLSGSGKAVANLSVRIALGTVLTNKVFSVLMVDEIDASMDKDRAEYTAQCLRNLTKVFGQIILVSHKKPEADHQIEL